MDNIKIYLKPDRSVVIFHSQLLVKDVMNVYCIDPEVTYKVEEIPLHKFHQTLDEQKVISALMVIEKIQNMYKDASIINLGDTEFIVFHKKPMEQTKRQKANIICKVIFVSLITFFGSAFTIMTYNNDVGVNDIFTYLYTLFMGVSPTGNTALEIGYTLGLPLGLLFFFNHAAMHRLSDDPTPLEVEMRLYERDVNDTLAIDAERKKKIIDV